MRQTSPERIHSIQLPGSEEQALTTWAAGGIEIALCKRVREDWFARCFPIGTRCFRWSENRETKGRGGSTKTLRSGEVKAESLCLCRATGLDIHVPFSMACLQHCDGTSVPQGDSDGITGMFRPVSLVMPADVRKM